MLFFLLTNVDAFRHFLCQQRVFILGSFFAVLHELHGEGKAKSTGQEGVLEDLGLLGFQFYTCVLLPDFIVGMLFL